MRDSMPVAGPTLVTEFKRFSSLRFLFFSILVGQGNQFFEDAARWFPPCLVSGETLTTTMSTPRRRVRFALDCVPSHISPPTSHRPILPYVPVFWRRRTHEPPLPRRWRSSTLAYSGIPFFDQKQRERDFLRVPPSDPP